MENITGIASIPETSDFRYRRGKVILHRDYLLDKPIEAELKALFSNFYPVAISDRHDYNFFDKFEFIGYSSHFEVLEEGEVIPEYTIQVKITEEGTVVFDKFDKV